MGADIDAPDDAGDPVFVAYLRAKGAADDNVRARKALEWTIVRPGHLTNDPGTGPRAIADEHRTWQHSARGCRCGLARGSRHARHVGQTFEVISGDTPIADAVTTSTRE